MSRFINKFRPRHLGWILGVLIYIFFVIVMPWFVIWVSLTITIIVGSVYIVDAITEDNWLPWRAR